MTIEVCDHKSVGMLVWKGDKLLLIERKKYPFGFAPPAGHVDNDPSFEISAKRELEEEVGLTAVNLNLIWEGRKENPCRRTDGTWHYYKVYTTEAVGELNPSLDETKQVSWYTKAEIAEFMKKTQSYIAGAIDEESWEASPGIEIVWYEFFQELDILSAH